MAAGHVSENALYYSLNKESLITIQDGKVNNNEQRFSSALLVF